MHAYNTKQKLTIQGKKHRWFINEHLEPFLKLRISNCQPEIEEFNKQVLANMNNSPQKSNTTESLDEESEAINCDKCQFTTTISERLSQL